MKDKVQLPDGMVAVSPELNEVKTMVKDFLKLQNTTMKDVIDMLNLLHPENQTTQQSMTNKLTNQTLKLSEAIEIADFFNYTVAFIPKNMDIYKMLENFEKARQETEDVKAVSKNYVTIDGKYFGRSVISGFGDSAELAASWLKEQLAKEDLTKAREIYLHVEAKKKFGVEISDVEQVHSSPYTLEGVASLTDDKSST